MPSITKNSQVPSYDPRWFVWTVVVLVASGTLLATYIAVTGSGVDDTAQFPVVKHTPTYK